MMIKEIIENRISYLEAENKIIEGRYGFWNYRDQLIRLDELKELLKLLESENLI